MNADWLLTLAPVIGMGVNVVLQICAARFMRSTALAILAGAGGGFVACAVSAMCSYRPAIAARGGSDVALVILTYLALAFGFWTFLNLNITSLRIRLLRELFASRDGFISRHELLSRYSAQEFLGRRLERLEVSNQVSRSCGRCRLESRTYVYLAHILSIARIVIIGKAHPLVEGRVSGTDG